MQALAPCYVKQVSLHENSSLRKTLKESDARSEKQKQHDIYTIDEKNISRILTPTT